MGVSGGGGEPRWALTVDVDAVELRRLTPSGVGTASTGRSWSGPVRTTGAAGGGKYCWWYSGYGLAAPALASALARKLGNRVRLNTPATRVYRSPTGAVVNQPRSFSHTTGGLRHSSMVVQIENDGAKS